MLLSEPRSSNRSQRFIAIGVGFLATLTAAYFYLGLSSIGFPDGYRSDLDRLREKTFVIFAALNLLLAMVAFYQGRTPKAGHQHRPKQLILTCIFLNGIIFATDYVCTFYFDHGIGG